MNEEIKPIDERKKLALLRYLAVLFAVAFLLVLVSLLAQMRNTNAAISQLTDSSASALQKAQQLQDTNRQLEDDLSNTRQAYELLLQARDPAADLPKILESLSELTQYLDQTGLEEYESLMEKVEKTND